MECHGQARPAPALELADVVSAFASELDLSRLMPEQVRALRAILQCRTGALGGHRDVCESCGFTRPAYNSCRNRHCPKCQHLAQAIWLAGREQHLLPVDYFHVVFTLPSQLRALVLANRRRLFDLLFRAASQTLLELGRDPERLGAQLGFTAVLHTWNRELLFHPHLHCIVTGGGLDESGQHFKTVRGGRFLFPVRVLSRLFRGKFLAGLVRLRKKGKLRFTGECAALAEGDVFHAFLAKLRSQEWNVYAKRPLAGAQQVYRYLGRYTHRVAIGNSRLLGMDERDVRFKTKDGCEISLPGPVFLRRFLLHVLPAGFVKIRHYGLLAPANVHTKLEQARRCLGLAASPAEPVAPEPADWRQRLLELTGIDLRRCPRCHGQLVPQPLPSGTPLRAASRSPPFPA